MREEEFNALPFTPAKIIEKKSGKGFGLLNNEVEFIHKGIRYRLKDWVSTELYVIWSDNTETLNYSATWLPDWIDWVCVKWIINFHPNRKR